MTTKSCKNCGKLFKSTTRRKTCSDACASALWRKQYDAKDVTEVGFSVKSLPDPELLPAAYVKQCYDLWLALSNDTHKKRIA